jgi:hypothetical protein
MRRAALLVAVVGIPLLARLGAQPDSPIPDRVWFTPAPASADMVRLFEAADEWSRSRDRIDVFKFYQQHTLAAHPVVGPNTFEALSRVGAFRKVGDWGKRLALEAGAVKEFYCTADATGMTESVKSTVTSLAAIEQAGGTVSYLAMDEPFLAGRSLTCGGPGPEPTADRLTTYITGVKRAYPQVRIGLIEPYPAFSVEELAAMLRLTRERGVPLAFLHVDVNLDAVNPRRHYVQRDMARLSVISAAEQVPFGVIVWGVNGDDAALYSADALQLASAFGTGFAQWKRSPDHVIFQSWAESAGGQRAIPNNLPESDPMSMTGIMERVLWLWGDVLVRRR